MSAKILSGRELSQQIQLEIKKEAAAFKAAWNVEPTLALIRAGDDPASVSYAGMIERTCNKTDIVFEAHTLPADVSEDEMIRLVRRLNDDPKVHGIIL
jgi:methylenetetrahydrofolate dehydrogenase (NADP+)/methenyltetrahydrofolate cyclohydrolase